MCLVFVTICLFLGQKFLVRKQKSDYGLEVPFLTSTILMASSFVNLPAYIHYLHKGKLKAKSCLDIVKRYGVLGCIDGTQSILATYSFLNLEGSAYILIKCSSIVFSFLLSKLVLKKETNVHHYISVFGIIVAIVFYYFGEIQKENLDPDDPDSLARTDLDRFDIEKWYIPAIIALLSDSAPSDMPALSKRGINASMGSTSSSGIGVAAGLSFSRSRMVATGRSFTSCANFFHLV